MATAMIASSSSRGRPEIQTRNTCPPESDLVTSHDPNTVSTKVPLVYYLTRNGNLEHPHFMEVPLSSNNQGRLYLRDVINRLVILRGRGMTDLYSWSCKRSYKNGFVWHDLEENDFVYPAHAQEYVLKGTELFHAQITSKSNDIDPPPSAATRLQPPMLIRNPAGGSSSSDDSDFPMVTRQRNQSWTAADFNEYKVYKSDIQTHSGGGGRAAANASTQTEDRRSRRRTIVAAVVENEEEEKTKPSCSRVSQQSTELRREDISPPPSDSSPETLASLLKGDTRVILCPETKDVNPSGRLRASSVLMQLISCGSMSFKDCGPTCWKEEGGEERQGFNLISYYKGRLPRGGRDSNQVAGKVSSRIRMETSEKSGEVKMEEKEYFSGSLIQTKKDEIPILKRSASFSAADRSSTQTWK